MEDTITLEASTLFRRQDTGKDMAATFIIPKVKIQSNFTFSMASSGDPSTFTASTLFRRQDTGKDMAATFIIPKVKIQSNFTFSMASSGDPSTFTFTMDAFPDYTKFDKTKEVLFVLQIIE